MRRCIVFGLVACCAVLLVGCDNGNRAQPTEPAQLTPSSTPNAIPPISISKTAVIIGLSPTLLPGYDCEVQGQCGCPDFQVRSEAQRIFLKHGGQNWARLDPDGDGLVCDELP